MAEPDHGEPPTGGSGGGGLFTDGAAGSSGAAGSRCDNGHMLPRSSEMPDVSSADISAKECNVSNPEIEGGDLESGLAGQATLRLSHRQLPFPASCLHLPSGTVVEMEAGRWERELTLAQPWRFHTLKGLSQDCIAHWTDSNEAEFQDGMYHSGFKWRVFMLSSLTVGVILVVLVEPCLTMLGVLALPVAFLLLSSQTVAQRMVDKRRGRQLGQCSFMLLWIAFSCALVPLAIYATSGAKAPKWNGGMQRVLSKKGSIDPTQMFTINLSFAPCGLLVGVMITFMTVSTRGFVAMVAGYTIPKGAAYLLRESRFRSNLAYRISVISALFTV